ncbi:AI-2E family transporter [Marinobacter sp. 1_MG-2023]|uniref:AI-2E family transporter n=1 Tax=Marinobacter sp. 1_MG-2023 TaxID=3062627 RepID=UPI0026E2C825|nr:AI-2E family transporter [Marinobacter sp. 1_MG-2023]MDO6824993.1 AI-2E family transporter [Marinobacter sp. 1_MG-2023]
MPGSNAPTPISSYTRKVWIAVSISAVMAGALILLWHGFQVLLLIFAGLLLGTFLLVPAGWLCSHSFLSRGWSLSAVILSIAGLLALLGMQFASGVNEQFEQLAKILPDSVSELKEQFRKWPMGTQIIERFSQEGAADSLFGQWFSKVSLFLSSTLSIFLDLFFVVFIALFFAFEPGTYRSGLLSLIPPRQRATVTTLTAEISQRLYWWLLGRLLSMTVVGVATGMGLWLLGVPMVLSLALLAALLVSIPNLGPILAAIPALLVALPDGQFLPVLVLYLAVQAVESNMITPLVDRRSVKLPPALLLSAQIIMGLTAGILGLVLAAPLTVLGMVVVKRLYVDTRVEQ